MAVTRIKNNQIFDSTITYQKIAAGTLVGSNFNANLTLNSNVSIIGNLTVTGTSSTVSSTNTYVNDPLIVFNNGYSGSLSGYDIGILVNRNLAALGGYGSVNTAWIWDETAAQFQAITTTDTGGGITALNNSGFANVRLGNLTAYSLSLSGGTLSGTATTANVSLYEKFTGTSTNQSYYPVLTDINATGNASAFTQTGLTFNPSTNNLATTTFTGTFSGTAAITNGSVTGVTGQASTFTATNLSSGNAVITGGSITGATGQFSTLTATNFSAANAVSITGASIGTALVTNFSTANAQITGGSIAGAISGTAAFSTSTSTNFSTGNAQITGGAITGMTGQFSTLTATNFSSANAVSITGASIGTALVTNFSTANAQITGGAITGSTGQFSTLTATNFSTGNAVITGGSITGGTGQFSTLTATNLSSGNAQITAGNVQGISYLQATNLSTGNAAVTGGSITGATGQFSTLTATNLSSGNIVGVLTGTASTSNVSLYNNFTATTTNASYYPLVTDRNTTGNAANFIAPGITFNPSTNAITATTFTGTFSGTASITSGSVTGITGAATTLVATNLSSGNAQITGGSITSGTGQFSTLTATNFSTANAVITGGSINSTPVGATNASTGKFTTVQGTDTTNASSSTTGALIIAGGAGVAKDLWVGGNLYVQNIIGTTTQIITIQDSLVYLQAPNPGGTYNYDQGIYSDMTIGGVYQHTGVIRNYTTGIWGFASNVNTEPTGNTFAWSDAGLIWDGVKAGSLTLANNTSSTNTTSGALVVTGGAGIGGALNVGGQIYAAGFNGTITTANVSLYESLTATSTNANYYLQITDRSTTGNASSFVGSGITFNPSTNNLATTTFTGTFSGTASITSGSVTGITGQATTFTATNLSSGNAQITGGSITGGTGQFSTLTATNFSSGNVTSVTGSAGTFVVTNFSTANAQVTGGAITGSTGQFSTLTATNFSTANAVITGGSAQGLSSLNATNFSTGNALITGGSITGGTGAFTTLTATNFSAANAVSITGASIGTALVTNLSSGNAQITGGSITSGTGQFSTLTATNFSTANAVVTGGSVNSTPIGATTASTGKFTTLDTSGVTNHAANVVISVTTDTTAPNIGALVIPTGGISVTGNAYVGNNLYIGATAMAQQANFANPTIIAVDSGSNYAQLVMKNTNGNGSADYAAYSDNGTDAGGWIDMGIAGTTYNDANYTITKPQDGSLMVRPTSNTYGGNLVIATSEAGSYNDIVIGVGSFAAASEVARFHGNISTSGYLNLAYTTAATSSTTGAIRVAGGVGVAGALYNGGVHVSTGNVVAASTTDSTSTTTGALVVAGGVGIAGNVFAGKAATFNSSQTSGMDFKVMGTASTNLLWAKSGTYDQVMIGNTAAVSGFVTGAKLQINSTDSILIPAGTSAQRPGSSGGTDTLGMIRYNTTLNGFEYYGGSTPGWQQLTSQFTIIADDQFSGDGTTTVFTLTTAQTTNSCIVSINGVIQIPTLAYSVTGTTMTFTEAPASGDVIDVRKLTTTQTITQIASSNGYAVVSADNTGLQFYSGASSQTLQYVLDTSGAWVTQRANTAVASANTATAIDTFATATYRSAKYVIQATAAGKYQTMEALVVHDDTTPSVSTFGVVQTNGNLGVLSASIAGGTMTLNFIAANASTNVRVRKEYMPI